jgi:hypothetical protein
LQEIEKTKKKQRVDLFSDLVAQKLLINVENRGESPSRLNFIDIG